MACGLARFQALDKWLWVSSSRNSMPGYLSGVTCSETVPRIVVHLHVESYTWGTSLVAPQVVRFQNATPDRWMYLAEARTNPGPCRDVPGSFGVISAAVGSFWLPCEVMGPSLDPPLGRRGSSWKLSGAAWGRHGTARAPAKFGQRRPAWPTRGHSFSRAGVIGWSLWD